MIAADRSTDGSSRRIARSIADGTLQLGPVAAYALDGFRGSRWDHADDRFQALSADLARVVRTASAALATAPPERRPAIAELAAASLHRIEAALTADQIIEPARSECLQSDRHQS